MTYDDDRIVTVLGAGPGDPSLLTVAASRALREADLIVGARRLLDDCLPCSCDACLVPETSPERIVSTLADDDSWLSACVVMSGDVGLFSGARLLPDRLRDALPGCEVRVLPGVSSAQMLAARLEVPWQNWTFASAHGVSCDVAALVREAPGPVFLVTGGAGTRAHELCARLVEAGLDEAFVSVGERLSYPDERVVSGAAEELAREEFSPLAAMLVELPPKRAASEPWPWVTPGIPDERFARGDVPMTKQEVRAVALAKLRVAPDDVVYDIGAGTGSVSVELGLLASRGQVFAVERDPAACGLIRRNAQAFGLANLTVVEGRAPAALDDLPAPDAAFVGGTAGGLEDILACLLRANPQVRVVVTCVTLETLAQATALLASPDFEGFEACQVSVARSDEAGAYHLMRAQNPVFVVSARGRGTAL